MKFPLASFIKKTKGLNCLTHQKNKKQINQAMKLKFSSSLPLSLT